jgi:hypothetical protein
MYPSTALGMVDGQLCRRNVCRFVAKGVRTLMDEAFEQAIFDHLALTDRNKKLERSMPIDQYRGQYGGAVRPNKDDERRDQLGTAGFVRDFEWDSTAERSLPTFDDWDGDA